MSRFVPPAEFYSARGANMLYSQVARGSSIAATMSGWGSWLYVTTPQVILIHEQNGESTGRC